MLRCYFIIAFLFLSRCAGAQSPCPALQAPVVPPGANLFTGQQETELGEIIRQQVERDFLVIDEQELTGYVKSVGGQIISHLPDTGLKYEFSLYDQPEIQAFGMPGGHIYISRKMVAFLRTKDELAGLIGHELGHLVARQQAVEISRAFRDVLGVKTLSADEDLFDRYNDLIDRLRVKKQQSAGNAEKGQQIADQLGVQAVARAGYAQEPLRDDIQTFRFSSDGKYLLAQDEGGIYVSTREPLRFVFRIEAPDAGPAQFSPDARHIVFFNRGLRVETWDVEREEQTSLADVPALHGCRNTALSADARYLACMGNNMTLSLYDVTTGETVLQVEKFFAVDGQTFYHHSLLALLTFLTKGSIVTLRFSPDGHYFAASSRTDQEVVFDLIARKKINIPSTLRTAISYAFTFVGQDQIVGVDRFRQEKSPLLEFPSGKVIEYIPLGGDTLLPATNARYLLIGPLKERPVGAVDLVQKKMVFANRTEAVDVWGEVVASERLNGEIGVYRVGEAKPTTLLTLPLGKLGTLQSFAVSPDLRWLAMSGAPVGESGTSRRTRESC
jgi:hypothetical protein